MEEVFVSVMSSHNGISYATITIFGSFIFLIIMTRLFYSGNITEVLRKTCFFSMLLLYIQGFLGLSMAIFSPKISYLMSFLDYFMHFLYTISILLCGVLMTFVYLYLKKHEVLSLKMLIITLFTALLFKSVYPWEEILGF